jgi:hypothetical protein
MQKVVFKSLPLSSLLVELLLRCLKCFNTDCRRSPEVNELKPTHHVSLKT